MEVPEDKREYCPKCKAYFFPIKGGTCCFCKTKTIKGYKEREATKEKIKLCQICFDDSDFSMDEVEIVSEAECVELNNQRGD